jgi:hypothetical protein
MRGCPFDLREIVYEDDGVDEGLPVPEILKNEEGRDNKPDALVSHP